MHCYAVKPDNYCDGTFTRLVNAFTGCTELVLSIPTTGACLIDLVSTHIKPPVFAMPKNVVPTIARNAAVAVAHCTLLPATGLCDALAEVTGVDLLIVWAWRPGVAAVPAEERELARFRIFQEARVILRASLARVVPAARALRVHARLP
jgi:hypothetical protein